MSVAALPMDDWPEVRAETDALWSAIGDGLRAAGVDAPAALTRPDDPWSIWRAPDLALAQTCGLPYAARLAGDVSLLGAPTYRIEDCPPGSYRSEIIVRADDPAERVEDLAGRRFAFNARESQSGWACFAASYGAPRAHFAEIVPTGAHRASVRAVAAGEADAAAIDAVSWRLALRHEPAAARLRVLTRTAPTPGLPFITAPRDDAALPMMRLVIETAILALPPTVSDALLLAGFAKWRPENYAPLAGGWPDSEPGAEVASVDL